MPQAHRSSVSVSRFFLSTSFRNAWHSGKLVELLSNISSVFQSFWPMDKFSKQMHIYRWSHFLDNATNWWVTETMCTAYQPVVTICWIESYSDKKLFFWWQGMTSSSLWLEKWIQPVQNVVDAFSCQPKHSFKWIGIEIDAFFVVLVSATLLKCSPLLLELILITIVIHTDSMLHSYFV